MCDWKDIIYAPRDGTRILTFNIHTSKYPAISWWAVVLHGDELEAWCPSGDHVPWAHQPTHWMHLPADPCKDLQDLYKNLLRR